jgi:hypothetical protein
VVGLDKGKCGRREIGVEWRVNLWVGGLCVRKSLVSGNNRCAELIVVPVNVEKEEIKLTHLSPLR